MKILVIDDSRSVQAFVKSCLAATQCHLIQVPDGEVGVLTAGRDTSFDLILLDWEMPKLTGPETILELKKNGSQIPIIMMTTRNSIADITAMLEKGVRDYLMKPFTKDILIEKIEAVTGKSVAG